jgi:hypothetical protein
MLKRKNEEPRLSGPHTHTTALHVVDSCYHEISLSVLFSFFFPLLLPFLVASCIYLTCLLELLKKVVHIYGKTIQKHDILPLSLPSCDKVEHLEGRCGLGGSAGHLLCDFVCPSCSPLRRMCCYLTPPLLVWWRYLPAE